MSADQPVITPQVLSLPDPLVGKTIESVSLDRMDDRLGSSECLTLTFSDGTCATIKTADASGYKSWLVFGDGQ